MEHFHAEPSFASFRADGPEGDAPDAPGPSGADTVAAAISARSLTKTGRDVFKRRSRASGVELPGASRPIHRPCRLSPSRFTTQTLRRSSFD